MFHLNLNITFYHLYAFFDFVDIWSRKCIQLKKSHLLKKEKRECKGDKKFIKLLLATLFQPKMAWGYQQSIIFFLKKSIYNLKKRYTFFFAQLDVCQHKRENILRFMAHVHRSFLNLTHRSCKHEGIEKRVHVFITLQLHKCQL